MTHEMNFTISRASTFAGVKIIESEAATALPDGKPFTDDMRDMVEHFHNLGLIKRKPAAFNTPNGLIIHPTMLRELRQSLSRRVDAMAEAAFYGAFRRPTC